MLFVGKTRTKYVRRKNLTPSTLHLDNHTDSHYNTNPSQTDFFCKNPSVRTICQLWCYWMLTTVAHNFHFKAMPYLMFSYLKISDSLLWYIDVTFLLLLISQIEVPSWKHPHRVVCLDSLSVALSLSLLFLNISLTNWFDKATQSTWWFSATLRLVCSIAQPCFILNEFVSYSALLWAF